jgi:hypothetical protein
MRILPPIYCGITNNTNIHFVQTSKHCEMLPKFWEAPQNISKHGGYHQSFESFPTGGLLPTLICPAWQTRAVCKDHPKQGLRATCLLSGRGAGQKSAKTNCIPEQVVLVIRNVNRCNSCPYFIWLVVSTPLKLLVNGKDYPIYYGK